MTWLTPEEREQNKIENENAIREGFADSYSKHKYHEIDLIKNQLLKIKQKISLKEIEIITQAHKLGLI